MWVGTIQSIESLNGTKRQRKVEFSLPDWLSWPSIFSCPWTGIYTISIIPGSQACRLGLEFTPPAFLSLQLRQMMGYHSLHIIMTQFLIINLILYVYTYTCISYWFCFSAAAAKSLQSCPTLCDPIDGSPTGSPVPGILQARTLEWVAISLSSAWK